MDGVPSGFWKDALGSVALVVVPIALVVAFFAWAQTRDPWIITGVLLAFLATCAVVAWRASPWGGLAVAVPTLALFAVSVAIDGPYLIPNIMLIVSMVGLFSMVLYAIARGSPDDGR